jgi:hypothetical protein
MHFYLSFFNFYCTKVNVLDIIESRKKNLYSTRIEINKNIFLGISLYENSLFEFR